MKKSGKKQDLAPITETEASRLLVSLSIYVVLEEAHQSTTLIQLIKRLMKDDTPAHEILIELMTHGDESLEDRIRELIDVADAHCEKNRLIRLSRNQKQSNRLLLPGPERYELAARIEQEVDALYPTMPSRKATYNELAKRSMELFEEKLSAGSIEGRYRWIWKQRAEEVAGYTNKQNLPKRGAE